VAGEEVGEAEVVPSAEEEAAVVVGVQRLLDGWPWHGLES